MEITKNEFDNYSGYNLGELGQTSEDFTTDQLVDWIWEKLNSYSFEITDNKIVKQVLGVIGWDKISVEDLAPFGAHQILLDLLKREINKKIRSSLMIKDEVKLKSSVICNELARSAFHAVSDKIFLYFNSNPQYHGLVDAVKVWSIIDIQAIMAYIAERPDHALPILVICVFTKKSDGGGPLGGFIEDLVVNTLGGYLKRLLRLFLIEVLGLNPEDLQEARDDLGQLPPGEVKDSYFSSDALQSYNELSDIYSKIIIERIEKAVNKIPPSSAGFYPDVESYRNQLKFYPNYLLDFSSIPTDKLLEYSLFFSSGLFNSYIEESRDRARVWFTDKLYNKIIDTIVKLKENRDRAYNGRLNIEITREMLDGYRQIGDVIEISPTELKEMLSKRNKQRQDAMLSVAGASIATVLILKLFKFF
jgi:hypothetical protein